MLNVVNPARRGLGGGAKNADCRTTKSKNEYTPDRHREQPFDGWVEYKIALANRGVDEILRRHGVVDPAARAICGRGRIVRVGGRFFEFHPNGEWAVIVPVIDCHERSIVDLLAFSSDEPNKWLFRIGSEHLLDGDALGDQLLGRPLHIFRTPLSWLKGRCAGVVIFDIERAFFDLRTAPNGIIGEDDAHTEALRRAMAKAALRNMPRFLRRVA